MKPRLLALHGYTLNATHTRAASEVALGPLADTMELCFLDAPHACPPEAVAEAYARWETAPLAPPYRTWWYADDAGSVYRGWEVTRDHVRQAVPEHGSFALFGFSQGAMVAATLCALAERGEFPRPSCVVLVAGRTPRAPDLAALFEQPITVPSLHIWGERDQHALIHAPQLLEHFAESSRQNQVWRGSHVIPPGGAAARGITEFIRQHT